MEPQGFDEDDDAAMPSFTFVEERASTIIRRVAQPFAVLLCAAGVPFASALRRYAASPAD